MVRPETPLIYCALPTVADMRTGAYAPGGIETGILMAGCSQMARYYGVPSGGYIGLTNSKVNDAQSGYETGMSTVAAVMAGVDMLNMGGLLDALMTFDYAKAVIDDEIALMLKRVKQGFDVDEENLSLQVIAEVGPGGMFMEHPHTLGRMRKTALLPAIADRNSRQQWKERGGLDAHARALTRARDILARNNPAVFSAEVDERIRPNSKIWFQGYPLLSGFWRTESLSEEKSVSAPLYGGLEEVTRQGVRTQRNRIQPKVPPQGFFEDHTARPPVVSTTRRICEKSSPSKAPGPQGWFSWRTLEPNRLQVNLYDPIKANSWAYCQKAGCPTYNARHSKDSDRKRAILKGPRTMKTNFFALSLVTVQPDRNRPEEDRR